MSIHWRQFRQCLLTLITNFFISHFSLEILSFFLTRRLNHIFDSSHLNRVILSWWSFCKYIEIGHSESGQLLGIWNLSYIDRVGLKHDLVENISSNMKVVILQSNILFYQVIFSNEKLFVKIYLIRYIYWKINNKSSLKSPRKDFQIIPLITKCEKSYYLMCSPLSWWSFNF